VSPGTLVANASLAIYDELVALAAAGTILGLYCLIYSLKEEN